MEKVMFRLFYFLVFPLFGPCSKQFIHSASLLDGPSLLHGVSTISAVIFVHVCAWLIIASGLDA